ncbi:DUF1801 domain-containing protein [Loktanella sp. IMCC34160]|uniref:DUF1801 domain-containing protein n=1 Tax=Loktanella sp. IMCC34160 TaxID=2510646 RepID=UPI00101B670D|nr:DUF1801 domain-containing protein [Loktanella sp. IMCC34160]RYG93114.1 DUF1801 domain-containing protein [Loktanella sp. IMCC34160]
MAQNKTQVTATDPADFIAAVDHPQRRDDAQVLDALFRHVTGFQPRMWGPSIIGYGQYHYRYDSGREGDFLATGFSPRKANQVIYILPGYTDFGPILDRLGKWKKGKSCLYITKLADVDLSVLEELIRAGLDDLNSRWPVQPT